MKITAPVTHCAVVLERGIATHLYCELFSELGLPLIVVSMYKVPITMELC